jgi:vesicle-associated membrane protein 72
MPILYSAVFRGTVNLADFSTISGNFSAVAKEYLEKAARNDGKFTYVVEGTTFNFFTREGTSESPHALHGRLAIAMLS